MTPKLGLRAVSAIAASLTALASGGAALSAPVAYVDRFFPADARFHVERAGRRLPMARRNVDLRSAIKSMSTRPTP
jgi:hypothetical protein